MTTDTTVYIAETNEDGEITCVWLSDRSKRGPRVIRNPSKHIERLASTECSGASKDAIEGWMRRSAEILS